MGVESIPGRLQLVLEEPPIGDALHSFESVHIAASPHSPNSPLSTQAHYSSAGIFPTDSRGIGSS